MSRCFFFFSLFFFLCLNAGPGDALANDKGEGIRMLCTRQRRICWSSEFGMSQLGSGVLFVEKEGGAGVFRVVSSKGRKKRTAKLTTD